MIDKNSDHNVFPKDIPIPKRSWRQRLLALAIITGILLAGAGTAAYLLKTKPTAKKKPPAKMQTMVATMAVAPITTNARITALGRIIPAREITLQARISGRVEYLHPDFTPGGIIAKDEMVIRIDDTDYRLNRQLKLNVLAQARADLRIEEGNQAVAEQEWSLINRHIADLDTSSNDLALRKPQLEKVKATLGLAETELEKSAVDLERTEIRAPFNAIIRQKNIDLGSQITSQSTIGVLTDIDTFWAEISIPVASLAWLTLPADQDPGSEARIFADDETSHSGQIVKLLPDVDANGLMARLLVAIEDPLAMKSGRQPLLLGTYVRAEFIGRQMKNVFQVPRAALLDGEKILTITPEKNLHIQPVSVIWRNTDFVFINAGLQEGDNIIISSVPAPIEGMSLETTDQEKALKQTGEVNGNERQQ